MSWSIPVKQGWKLRVLTGSSQGREIDLPPAQYILGSHASATIIIPHGSIAPQHVVLEVRSDGVDVRDRSSGRGLQLNGQSISSARAGPGDRMTVGDFEFEFVNPGLAAARATATSSARPRVESWLRRFERWQQVGLVSCVIALLLYALLTLTGNVIMIPATLLAMSLVVPATVIFYLVDKHDQTKLSFHTLALTFLAGGTVGVLAATVLAVAGGALSLGLLLLPVFAGVFEEPAKLLATAWRWKHPVYDRPMDGLILGTVSGLGFAVFETAGYGLYTLLTSGYEGLFGVMFLRSISSPFGHGLWSGILAAAFWQFGRDLRSAWRDRRFRVALAFAVGLHALWNVGAGVAILDVLAVAASAYLSWREYRRLLGAHGYR